VQSIDLYELLLLKPLKEGFFIENREGSIKCLKEVSG
jgi:hypothetical protein